MKEPILLIGGGGHCKSCIDVIEQEGRFSITGILDLSSRIGEQVLGHSIVASDSDIPKLSPQHWCLVTIGQIRSSSTRLRLYETLIQYGAKLPVVISPRAYVSPHAKIGEGSIIMHGATVNAGGHVGKNCIINSHALVEHDAVVGDHCHIATGAIVNGGVQVGDRCFIGSNAVTKEYIVIGQECFIGAGVHILHDLASGSRLSTTGHQLS